MRKTVWAMMLAASLQAQVPTEPPPIVQVVIRRPGSGSTAPRPYGEAKAAVNVVGMASMTGEPEIWSLECHANFASIEDLDRGLQSAAPARGTGDRSDPLGDDAPAPPRTMILTYTPGWSYRGDQAIRMFPRARYFDVSIYRLRPGTEGDYGQLLRMERQGQDAINLDRPVLAYEVRSGAPSGTFLFLAPIASLRSFDEGVAAPPVYAEGLTEARNQARSKVAPDAILGHEHLLFRVDPRLSYVSDEFAAADPDFWRGKR